MEDIWSYTDYQKWLKDSVEELKRHKPIASWRWVAGRVGLDAGNLLRVAQGKVHISVDSIGPLADFFHLAGRERTYFEEMVYFGRARTDKEALDHYERMQSIKGVPLRTLAGDGEEFWAHWWHNAIRFLLSITPIRDEYGLLGRMCSPPISAETAQASVELLERLGMIRRKPDDGCFEVTDLFVSSGQQNRAEAIKAFQRQCAELGLDSHVRHPAELRDLSTVTLTLARREIPVLRERIREFRAELLRFSQEGTGDDTVLQLNIQLFPVGILPSTGAQP